MDGREGTFTCDARGYFEMECASGDRCADGACRPPACTPSLFYCDHEVARVCDATGTLEQVTDCGTMHARCVVGPASATCVPSECAPLTTFCAPDGSTLEKCAPDGLSSSTVQACDDPMQRGNTCVGNGCHDRCALLEANDRSTLGCRFVAAALAAGSPTVVIANPQTDLPARVTLTPPTGAARTVTVSPSGSAILAIDAAPAPAAGASIAARGSSIVSTVPVYAWIYESGADGLALHPEHALSTSYLVGALPAGPQQVVALATAANTQVTLTTAAGTPYSGTLARGQALTVSASDLIAARVAASAPIAVEVYASGGEASMPGAETLGQDFVVLRSCTAVARDAATVTSSLNGTSTIAAGATLDLSGPERVQSTAPLLIVDASGGLEVVAPVEQWRSAGFAPPPGPSTLLAAATQPGLVDVGAGTLAVVAGPTTGWASGSTTLAAAAPLSAATPFFVLVTDGTTTTVPAAYGLASIHP